MLENNQKEIILLEDLGLLYPTATSIKKYRYGLFRCFCGTEFKTQMSAGKKQYVKSCGCFNMKRITTHGFGKHRLYSTWKNMMSRCHNENDINYKYYGDRGIAVCDEWHNIANFVNDMYPSFTEGLTLDREDNDLGYSKSNCRWTTKVIQSRNTRVLKTSNTSGYRGISFCKDKNKYKAEITVKPKKIHIGYFKTAIEGAKAYDKYVIDNNLEHSRNFS